MRLAFALAVAILIGSNVPSRAETAPPPVPIEEWPLNKIAAMGREIHQQDVAGWVATDALMAKLPRREAREVRGWIVLGEGENRTVRFLRKDKDGVKAGWDVPVVGGRAGEVKSSPTPLSEREFAMTRALRTAGANVGELRCSANMNTVVADDPDSDGWLVWLLTAGTEAGVVHVGGHYRFLISADGRAVLRRDRLSNSCLSLKQLPKDKYETASVNVSHLVSSGPVETHVFLSLQHQLPFYVVVGDKLFEVDGVRISEVSTEPRTQSGTK